MTDCTHVKLTIRKIDQKEFLLIDEKYCGFQTGPIESLSENQDELLTFEYDDVNYTNLGLEQAMQQQGIPFDKKWDHGDEYPEGILHLRFYSDGSAKILEKLSHNHLIGLKELQYAQKNNNIDNLIHKYKELSDVMSWNKDNNTVQ